MNNYTAAHVANFFLEKAEKEQIELTQMKLMKLVYIGFGWVYAVLDRKLFEEPIQAWQHGPVIRSLYDEFKRFGSSPIAAKAVEFDLDNFETTTPVIPEDETKVLMVLDKVWNVYRQFSASSLRQKTHEPGTPWKSVYDPCYREAELDVAEIKTHFTDKISSYLNG